MINHVDLFRPVGQFALRVAYRAVGPTRDEKIAGKRKEAIDSVLGSDVQGVVDVYAYRRRNGYGELEVVRLRQDVSRDSGVRIWLQNISSGIGDAFERDDMRAIRGYNRLLDQNSTATIQGERR